MQQNIRVTHTAEPFQIQANPWLMLIAFHKKPPDAFKHRAAHSQPGRQLVSALYLAGFGGNRLGLHRACTVR